MRVNTLHCIDKQAYIVFLCVFVIKFMHYALGMVIFIIIMFHFVFMTKNEFHHSDIASLALCLFSVCNTQQTEIRYHSSKNKTKN